YPLKCRSVGCTFQELRDSAPFLSGHDLREAQQPPERIIVILLRPDCAVGNTVLRSRYRAEYQPRKMGSGGRFTDKADSASHPHKAEHDVARHVHRLDLHAACE